MLTAVASTRFPRCRRQAAWNVFVCTDVPTKGPLNSSSVGGSHGLQQEVLLGEMKQKDHEF